MKAESAIASLPASSHLPAQVDLHIGVVNNAAASLRTFFVGFQISPQVPGQAQAPATCHLQLSSNIARCAAVSRMSGWRDGVRARHDLRSAIQRQLIGITRQQRVGDQRLGEQAAGEWASSGWSCEGRYCSRLSLAPSSSRRSKIKSFIRFHAIQAKRERGHRVSPKHVRQKTCMA